MTATAATQLRFVDGTEPYRWPWDGDLDPARLALVIAGADAAWLGRSVDAAEVTPVIDALAAAVRRAGALVVHVAHDPVAPGHPLDLPTTAGATETPRGAAIDATTDLTVVAGGIDGFFASSLDQRLRRAGRDRLLLAGYGLEGPVHSTLRSANDAGYECLLLTDASATLDPSCRAEAISIVTMSGGIFGAIGSATALATALLPDEPESP